MFNGFGKRNRKRVNSTSTVNSSASSPQPDGTTSSQSSNQNGNLNGTRDTVSDGEYAKKCRALMALLRDLRNLGADSVFDLPKIVVIGSQSAGKSSLIEAVTEINVPRDSGTCTRCPMECTMSSDAPSGWMCSISLRSGASGQLSQATRFGPDIRRKDEVELWLRRAQGAILSADPDKTQWLNKSADQIKQAIAAGTGMLMFTEDTIVVDIQDQGLTDLSFVDLPGTKLINRGRTVVLIVSVPDLGLIQNAEQKPFISDDAPDGTVFTMERDEKHGGNLHYASFDELEVDFKEKKVHPKDLKTVVANGIARLLEPIRKAFEENEEWQKIERLAYPDPNAKPEKKKKKEKVYHPPPPGKGKNTQKPTENGDATTAPAPTPTEVQHAVEEAAKQ
ncbi:Interferon-induced GTP-binding protein Mx2 [Leucoagaricus sp. SymC.cos]|nr:Interferon-induced GTP-binding protein Mx2 [Leucoagaricus sp. SymC.cos]